MTIKWLSTALMASTLVLFAGAATAHVHKAHGHHAVHAHHKAHHKGHHKHGHHKHHHKHK